MVFKVLSDRATGVWISNMHNTLAQCCRLFPNVHFNFCYFFSRKVHSRIVRILNLYECTKNCDHFLMSNFDFLPAQATILKNRFMFLNFKKSVFYKDVFPKPYSTKIRIFYHIDFIGGRKRLYIL